MLCPFPSVPLLSFSPTTTADEALLDLNKAIELDPDNKPVKAGDYPSVTILTLSIYYPSCCIDYPSYPYPYPYLLSIFIYNILST